MHTHKATKVYARVHVDSHLCEHTHTHTQTHTHSEVCCTCKSAEWLTDNYNRCLESKDVIAIEEIISSHPVYHQQYHPTGSRNIHTFYHLCLFDEPQRSNADACPMFQPSVLCHFFVLFYKCHLLSLKFQRFVSCGSILSKINTHLLLRLNLK